MTEAFEHFADEAEALARRCYPIFAGQDRMVQSAALVELVARHLAGHVILGDAAATKMFRTMLLEEFVKAVEGLIPILDEGVIQPEIARRAQ